MNITRINATESAGPPRLVRHNGRIVALSELSGAEIARALPRATQNEIRSALGMTGASSHRGNARKKGRVEIVIDALAYDPACQGKSDLALKILSNGDLANLPGEAIVNMLSHSASETADPEAAARDEMKKALAKQGNSNICAIGGSGSGGGAEAASTVWDQAGKATFGKDWGK